MKKLLAATLIGGLLTACAHLEPTSLAQVERVATFDGPMPCGVTVAENGRIFINYPHWGDNPPFTVGELKNGRVFAYPNAAVNRGDPARAAETLISVQSVVADGANRLWILDTGAPNFSKPIPGGAKLVAVDMATNQIVRSILLGPDVLRPNSYVNDMRFDLRQGKAGVAYITDSSAGGIIVVDLASEHALRRLSGHASVSPDPDFVPKIEGTVLMNRPADGSSTPFQVASDGIAISPDGALLYYSPLSSRHLYSVPTALLRDVKVSDDTIAAAVRDLGLKGASDGLAEDAQGRIYGGDYENNAIRQYTEGHWQTLAQDPRILWPDTLSIGTDGYLYFTANQLHRQAGFHNGVDQRQRPYELLRIHVGSGPVILRR
jgi:sugar lactone lactonase YvrE